MIRLIFKNLWARRYRNGWLLAELIVVSVVVWYLADPIVVLTHDRHLPTGFQEEGLYNLTLASETSNSPRYSEEEDTKDAKVANFRRIVERIRHHKDVQYASYDLGACGPFSVKPNGLVYMIDSIIYSFRRVYFEPQSDFFRTYGFDEVDGQTNEQLDALFFGGDEYCATTGSFPWRTLDYHFDGTGKLNPWTGQPEKSWTVKATIGKLRMKLAQPEPVIFFPNRLENFEVTRVPILIRTRPGVSEGRFMHEFREWADNELRIGNFYLLELQSFEEVMEKSYSGSEYIQNVNDVYYMNLLLGGFFLINLFLGVSGAFWMQTRSRYEEVGIMKSFGGSNGFVVRMLLGEGWVLTTVATLIGCFLYLQYAVSEGLQGAAWQGTESEYWVNNFWPHFFGVSAIVWVIMLIVVSVGILIPARSLSQITPVEALRDE